MMPPSLRYPALALLLALTACAPQKKPPPFDAMLNSAVDRKMVPGAVAMIATANGVVYEGAANLSRDAIFAIASMTKPVTSVAVMQLVEAGKVKLDDPASVYLPESGKSQVLDNGKLRAPSRPSPSASCSATRLGTATNS